MPWKLTTVLATLFSGWYEFPIAVKSRYLIQVPTLWTGRSGMCNFLFTGVDLPLEVSGGLHLSLAMRGNQGFEHSKSNKNLESNQFGRG